MFLYEIQFLKIYDVSRKQELTERSRKQKISPHCEALSELEFRKAFLILSYIERSVQKNARTGLERMLEEHEKITEQLEEQSKDLKQREKELEKQMARYEKDSRQLYSKNKMRSTCICCVWRLLQWKNP
ncbi:hypothetical protein U1Q18_026289 [Sarracenia purpurea var. burkii]